MRENASSSLDPTSPTPLNLPGLESYLITPNVVGVKKASSLSIDISLSFMDPSLKLCFSRRWQLPQLKSILQ